jgi:hypothetical protein
MKVARAYGDRPEVFTRVSWNALLLLSSPTMPPAVREGLEARILAGEPISGPDIVHAREGRFTKTGRPKRRKSTSEAYRMSAFGGQAEILYSA